MYSCKQSNMAALHCQMKIVQHISNQVRTNPKLK